METVYSGSTATNASSATASPLEISTCTASAAQASRKLAETTAAAKITSRGNGAEWTPAARIQTAGAATSTAGSKVRSKRNDIRALRFGLGGWYGGFRPP